MPVTGQPAYEIAELYPPQGQWTEVDYFALPDKNRYIELSAGRIIMPPHPTLTHQRIVLAVAEQIRRFVKENNYGEVFIAPLPVRLWPGKIREPDIFFIAKEHFDRLDEQFCGIPDLVVEVLSLGTAQVDRSEKFLEYAQAGVEEYWLIDPDEKSMEVYVLKKGAYLLLGKYGPGTKIDSKVLKGLQLEVNQIL